MWKDVAKRPFITVGFRICFTDSPGAYFHHWMDSSLGGKRWQMLHRAIYISAIAGVVHYYWLVNPTSASRFSTARSSPFFSCGDWAAGFQAPEPGALRVRPQAFQLAVEELSAAASLNSTPQKRGAGVKNSTPTRCPLPTGSPR